MTFNFRVTGEAEVQANLRMATSRLDAAAKRGIGKAAEFLKTESQKLVPVEFGVLKASAYTEARNRGFFYEVSVGYTAPYALFVHEKVDMVLKGQPRPSGQGHYWDPNGRPKFLEEPTRRLRPDMLEIVRKEMEIK